MTNPTSPRPRMGDELRAALKAIAEGYPIEVAEDRYILVENPKFRPDDGSSPKLIIDVWAVTRASTPTENEAGDRECGCKGLQMCAECAASEGAKDAREAISRARSASVTDWTDDEKRVLSELARKQELSEHGVLRQGLRLYQLHCAGKLKRVVELPKITDEQADYLETLKPTPMAHGEGELRDGIEAIYQNRQAELPKGCKMKGEGRYASDDTCEHCGLLEGEACKLWSEISDERLAKLRALAPAPKASDHAPARAESVTATSEAWVTDEAWERAMRSAFAQFSKHFCSGDLLTDEDSVKAALDDALQHATGILALRRISSQPDRNTGDAGDTLSRLKLSILGIVSDWKAPYEVAATLYPPVPTQAHRDAVEVALEAMRDDYLVHFAAQNNTYRITAAGRKHLTSSIPTQTEEEA